LKLKFENFKPNNRLLSHFGMILYSVLIAGSFSFGAMAIPFIEPILLTSLRFIFASIIMAIIFMISTKQIISIPRRVWRYIILGNLMGIYFVLMFVALEFTDPVSTGAVFTLSPFMAMFFGFIILNQKPSYFQIISLFIAGIGAIWVIFKGNISNLIAFNIGQGELLFFIGCACQSLYIPLVQKFNDGESIFISTLWTLISASICFFIYSLFVIDIKNILFLPPIVWFCLFYLTIFATAVSFYFLQFSSLYLPPGKTISYVYLTPVFILFIEGFLGHGWVNLSVLMGIIITAFGLIFLIATND